MQAVIVVNDCDRCARDDSAGELQDLHFRFYFTALALYLCACVPSVCLCVRVPMEAETAERPAAFVPPPAHCPGTASESAGSVCSHAFRQTPIPHHSLSRCVCDCDDWCDVNPRTAQAPGCAGCPNATLCKTCVGFVITFAAPPSLSPCISLIAH